MKLFRAFNTAIYASSLGAYLPGDPLFAGKQSITTNLYKLLLGLAGELFRCNGLLNTFNSEIFPDTTEKFLVEWEAVLGIDPGSNTDDQRRTDIAVQLSALGVQTNADFVALAALFGVPVTIVGDTYTITINIESALEQQFPYSFPLPFGGSQTTVLKTLFDPLIPANCILIITQV